MSVIWTNISLISQSDILMSINQLTVILKIITLWYKQWCLSTFISAVIIYLSANWNFFLWCVPMIKSGSLNWPWSTNILGNSNTQELTLMLTLSVWHQRHFDITDKNNTTILKISTYIYSITVRPVRLPAILVIMSVSTFISAVILICRVNNLQCHFIKRKHTQIRKKLFTGFFVSL